VGSWRGSAPAFAVVEGAIVVPLAQLQQTDVAPVAPQGDRQAPAVALVLRRSTRGRCADEGLRAQHLAGGEHELVALLVVQHERERLGRRDAFDGVQHRADDVPDLECRGECLQALVQCLELPQAARDVDRQRARLGSGFVSVGAAPGHDCPRWEKSGAPKIPGRRFN
jgi:hypothetical protein